MSTGSIRFSGIASAVTHEEAREVALALQREFARKRESLGMSKRELARVSGLDPKAITFLERGDRIANLATALRIASALGYHVEEELSRIFGNLDGGGGV